LLEIALKIITYTLNVKQIKEVFKVKGRKIAKMGLLLILGVFLIGSAIPVLASDSAPSSVTGYGRMMGQRLQTIVKVVSDLTGLGLDEVRDERQAGKSLASIASENGVDEATLASAVIESNQTRLKASLEAGKITQEQYVACVSQMEERVEERLERITSGGNGEGGFGRGRGMGNGNRQGRACDGSGNGINNR
jgi:hypothetical protein